MKILNYNIFQIIIALISVSFILFGVKKYFTGKASQTIAKLLFTIFIWSFILVFSLFPEIPGNVSESLGLGTNLNMFIFIGFVLVFLAIFKMLNLFEKMESTITEMVRVEALRELKKKNDK